MKVLSLDTSSKIASIAVLEGQQVLKQMENQVEKEHSETLMPMIKETLGALDITLDDIDLLACGIGPRIIYWY